MKEVKHFKDKEAIEKLKRLINESNVCMMCTNLEEAPVSTCPMATQQVNENGEIWFVSDKNSDHNRDIKADERVQLIYANPAKATYASIYGKAKVLEDTKKAEGLWSAEVKPWFEDGKKSENMSVIRVIPEEGFYWDAKEANLSSSLSMFFTVADENAGMHRMRGKLQP